MADGMADGMADVFCRPSSWPVRSQRRHAATIDFNDKVLALFSDVTSRLVRIETSLTSAPWSTPPGLDEPCVHRIGYDAEKITVLEKRVLSMEVLLFKASFDDFKVLDGIVADARAQNGACRFRDDSAEPEKEITPMHLSTPDDTMYYGIYDEAKDADTQTDHGTCVDKSVQVLTKDAECQWTGSEENFRTMLTHEEYTDIEHMALGGEWEVLKDPEKGDIVEVAAPFMSNDEYMQVQLRKGVRGRVDRVDEDGDLKVFFPGLIPYGLPAWFSLRFVDQSQFNKMKRRKSGDEDRTTPPGIANSGSMTF